MLELNGHFSKKGWTNIIAAFEKKSGKEYPRAKYKHKQGGLKKDWDGMQPKEQQLQLMVVGEEANGMFCITHCTYVVLIDKPC